MGILKILKRALRPNKRKEQKNKTGLVGPSCQRRSEGDDASVTHQQPIDFLAAFALVLVAAATVFLLLNIDTRTVILNRNDPVSKEQLAFMFNAQQTEATVLILHLRKQHRYSAN